MNYEQESKMLLKNVMKTKRKSEKNMKKMYLVIL